MASASLLHLFWHPVALNLLILSCAASAVSSTGASSNLLFFERMGAGPPAGWHATGSGYAWEAETKAGPLGIGAARTRLLANGRLILDSPARFMRRGANHVAAVWLRSEPPGLAVRLSVRDNNDERNVAFEKAFTTTSDWQFVTVQGRLPKAIKDRYYFTLSVAGSDATLWLDGLWLGESPEPVADDWRPPYRPAGARLQPEAHWGLVNADEPTRVRANVVGVTRKGCRLHLRAVHTCGLEAELPAVPIDDTGVWEHVVDVGGNIARPYGMVRLEATVKDAGGRPLSPMVETLLARAPKPVPGPLPSSPFGVHVLLREPDLDVAARLGYKWCRIHDASGITKWGHVEPTPGQWTWFDRDVDLARKHGFCILGMLDGSPAWESGTKQKGYFSVYGAPRNIDNWRTYVREVVTHYAGRIDDWEVWNEPWDMQRFFHGGTPMLYVKLLRAAYKEAKSANPNCTVLGVDTFPPMWDQMVLLLGALPYYDVLTGHRYDPCLMGRPDDAIARTSRRLRNEQAKHGQPKAMLCSEGGPDVSYFHGSFHSFADPALSGDWSLGADRYARMLLSAIASGNQRFFLYSMHGDNRYGWPIHMFTEPQRLLRPMLLASAGLAHMIEGARFERRLAPAPDISALVFRQPNDRPYAKGPSIVVALYAHGQAPEDLPTPLPAGVCAYDRFANPIDIPTQATRSPVYLVATAQVTKEVLATLSGRDAPGPAAPPTDEHGVEALLAETVRSLSSGGPPMWTLFSTQGSLLVTETNEGVLAACRYELKSDPGLARRFRLPGDVRLDGHSIRRSGELAIGLGRLTAGSSSSPQTKGWHMTFAATQDGSGGSWRHTALTIVPDRSARPGAQSAVLNALRRVEQAVAAGDVWSLREHHHRDRFLCGLCKSDGESFWLSDADGYLQMFQTAMFFGPPRKPVLTPSKVMVGDSRATLVGEWRLISLFFGFTPYEVALTLIRADDDWKLAGVCLSAEGKGFRPLRSEDKQE